MIPWRAEPLQRPTGQRLFRIHPHQLRFVCTTRQLQIQSVKAYLLQESVVFMPQAVHDPTVQWIALTVRATPMNRKVGGALFDLSLKFMRMLDAGSGLRKR